MCGPIYPQNGDCSAIKKPRNIQNFLISNIRYGYHFIHGQGCSLPNIQSTQLWGVANAFMQMIPKWEHFQIA